MFICIDIGNTNVKYAVFEGEELLGSFRVSTTLKRRRTNSVHNFVLCSKR